jgi:hypothetical protein
MFVEMTSAKPTSVLSFASRLSEERMNCQRSYLKRSQRPDWQPLQCFIELIGVACRPAFLARQAPGLPQETASVQLPASHPFALN